MARYRCFAEVPNELNENVLIGMVGVIVIDSGETNGATRDGDDFVDYLFRRTS